MQFINCNIVYDTLQCFNTMNFRVTSIQFCFASDDYTVQIADPVLFILSCLISYSTMSIKLFQLFINMLISLAYYSNAFIV